MTEKRFTFETDEHMDNFVFDNATSTSFYQNEIVDLLNEQNETIHRLQESLNQNIKEYLKLKNICNNCKKENEQLRTALKELKEIGDYQADRIQELSDENEQLKKRNENQYKQLQHLWSLMEAKDWETLSEMVNQMEEDEKRLQQEWKCYE